MVPPVHEPGGPKYGSAAKYRQIAVAAGLVLMAIFALAIAWFSVGQLVVKRPFRDVSETIPTTPPDESVSQALIVLDGAVRVSRSGGAYWSHHISYELTAEYPAAEVIEEISTRLEALGWKPLEDCWMNPGLPSSHVRGWGEFSQTIGNTRAWVHQWSGGWTDESGNIVDYSFRYTHPFGDAHDDLESLWINGSWHPAAAADIMAP